MGLVIERDRPSGPKRGLAALGWLFALGLSPAARAQESVLPPPSAAAPEVPAEAAPPELTDQATPGEPGAVPATPAPAAVAAPAASAQDAPDGRAAADSGAQLPPTDAGVQDPESPTEDEVSAQEEVSEEDLARFMAENNLTESGVKGPSFDIYGFADFSYWQYLLPSDSPWRFIYPNDGTFAVGNLNFYFDARIAATLRSLVELRFTYLPYGEISSFGTTVERDTAASSDYTRNERDLVVGGVNIARAFLEWEAHQLLKIKFGQWLTPYGIWNVDHGTPVIIPASRPFIIDEQLLPESQVGILATGRLELPQTWGLEYGLGISNGRGPIDRFMDMDSNRAVTGRLRATFAGLGDLSFGVSGYVGQYTNRQTALTITSSGTLASTDTILEQYDEVGFGADVRWILGGLHLQSEFLLNDRVYSEEGRTPGATSGTLTADVRRFGVYGLAGYRFDWLGLMPYATVEYSPVPSTNIVELPRESLFLSGGINIRPVPALVVKAGYLIALFPENRPGTFDEHPVQRLIGQMAWAF